MAAGEPPGKVEKPERHDSDCL
ncbi:MAG: hypothetical protein H6Q06_2490, partial [Acidobacteria bacterium]|nr:hypothetical protein [Acidobacteriota bacterium]